MEFYWNPCSFAYVSMAAFVLKAKLDSCDGDHVALKAQNICYLALLLTADLGETRGTVGEQNRRAAHWNSHSGELVGGDQQQNMSLEIRSPSALQTCQQV